jgi:hypothetical protein
MNFIKMEFNKGDSQMSHTEQSEHLCKLFTGLLRDRLTTTKMFDTGHIKRVFTKALEEFSYDQLWDAIYFSQEDDFWGSQIITIQKFWKHREQLVLKSKSYRCPRPEEEITPAVLPTKSPLQLYKERRNATKA